MNNDTIKELQEKAIYLEDEIGKYTKDYTRKDQMERINGQFKKLAGKINYMNRLTTMGRKFGRNTPCPCKSGKKFKHCCIANHDLNEKKVSALQTAMGKILSKVKRHGLSIRRS